MGLQTSYEEAWETVLQAEAGGALSTVDNLQHQLDCGTRVYIMLVACSSPIYNRGTDTRFSVIQLLKRALTRSFSSGSIIMFALFM